MITIPSKRLDNRQSQIFQCTVTADFDIAINALAFHYFGAITTVRFFVNDTGEAMRTSPYLPFAKSIVPLALSILRVTASTPRGKYWYHVDTPDLEPLHSILISRHPVWGWLSRWPASRGASP